VVVAPNGVVSVNTWSGRDYRNDTPPTGGFLVALQDTTGAGRADVVARFAPGAATRNAGGTGITLYNSAICAETNDRIVRYAPRTGTVAPSGPPEVIVSGLPLTGDHPMHPFRIDAQGGLYVDLAQRPVPARSRTACPSSQAFGRARNSRTRASIWRYDANRTGQRFSLASV
jgi:hypothetical protein